MKYFDDLIKKLDNDQSVDTIEHIIDNAT